jgi:hypothetical protein
MQNGPFVDRLLDQKVTFIDPEAKLARMEKALDAAKTRAEKLQIVERDQAETLARDVPEVEDLPLAMEEEAEEFTHLTIMLRSALFEPSNSGLASRPSCRKSFSASSSFPIRPPASYRRRPGRASAACGSGRVFKSLPPDGYLPLPSPTARICSISSNALCRSRFRTAFAAKIVSFATLLPSRFVKRFWGSAASKLSVGDAEFS